MEEHVQLGENLGIAGEVELVTCYGCFYSFFGYRHLKVLGVV